MINVTLEKSRFFVSANNLDEAMKNLLSDEFKDTLTENLDKDCYDPRVQPSPFTDVRSVLKRMGFSTIETNDGTVWISDFESSNWSEFQFRLVIETLLALSAKEKGSFACLKYDEFFWTVDSGKYVHSERLNGELSRIKIGKTPFHEIHS